MSNKLKLPEFLKQKFQGQILEKKYGKNNDISTFLVFHREKDNFFSDFSKNF